jgi:hypothetical protein
MRQGLISVSVQFVAVPCGLDNLLHEFFRAEAHASIGEST